MHVHLYDVNSLEIMCHVLCTKEEERQNYAPSAVPLCRTFHYDPLFFLFLKYNNQRLHFEESTETYLSATRFWFCVFSECLLPAFLTLTLTLMIQDSGPSNHRTMFRFSKLKLIGLGGMGMVPIRSFVTKTGIGLGGAKQIVNVTI